MNREYSAFGETSVTPVSKNRTQRDIGALRDDPFALDAQRSRKDPSRKDTFKPKADGSYKRGAFRQGDDSQVFKMNPKSEEFRQELNRRQYEHALPYFDKDAQRLHAPSFDEHEDKKTYVDPVAIIPHH